MATATPTFEHAPMRGRLQMMFYGGKSEPLEFFAAATRTDKGAINKANFEAMWHLRQRFMVRDDTGRVIYNGPVLDALGRPIFYDGRCEIYATDPLYDAFAAAEALAQAGAA